MSWELLSSPGLWLPGPHCARGGQSGRSWCQGSLRRPHECLTGDRRGAGAPMVVLGA